MSRVSVQDIQSDPQSLLRRTEAGESLLVVCGERALAEVRPLPVTNPQPRPYGLCSGQFTVPADFDQPLAEGVLDEFEGA